MKIYILKYALIFILFILSLSFISYKKLFFHYGSIFVYAEEESDEDEDDDDDDDDDGDEDEDDDDDDEDDDDQSGVNETEYETETITVTETVPAEPTYETVKVVTIDPSFKIDSDGDKLMDAIDPHPNVSEFLYFTDSDNDGVADYYDKHPDEDDFLYFPYLDENNNGIIDSFEP